jgi:hypothetical protein
MTMSELIDFCSKSRELLSYPNVWAKFGIWHSPALLTALFQLSYAGDTTSANSIFVKFKQDVITSSAYS